MGKKSAPENPDERLARKMHSRASSTNNEDNEEEEDNNSHVTPQSPDERLAQKLASQSAARSSSTDEVNGDTVETASTKDIIAGTSSNGTCLPPSDSNTNANANANANTNGSANANANTDATVTSTDVDPSHLKERQMYQEDNGDDPSADAESRVEENGETTAPPAPAARSSSGSQPGAYSVNSAGISRQRRVGNSLSASVQSLPTRTEDTSPEDEWNRQQNQDGVIVVEAMAIPDADVDTVASPTNLTHAASAATNTSMSTLTATTAPLPPHLRRQSNTNDEAYVLPVAAEQELHGVADGSPNEFNITTAYAVEEKDMKTPWYRSCVFLATVCTLCVVAIIIAALGGTGKLGGNSDTALAGVNGTVVPTQAPTPAPTQQCEWSQPLPREDLEGDVDDPNPYGPNCYNLVAISPDGTTAAIGYPIANNERGLVNILVKGDDGQWIVQARLEPSIDVDEEEALIGDGPGGTSGADTMREGPANVKAGRKTGMQFGHSVALAGDTLVVGTAFDSVNGEKSGSAYLFTRTGTTWQEQAKFVPDDGRPLDKFGWDVAINEEGTVAIIAAFGDDDERGSAYALAIDGPTWQLEAKLIPDDGRPVDYFAFHVDISGDVAIVGAPWQDPMADKSGAAYIFERGDGSWEQTAKIFPADGGLDHKFGERVAIDGRTAVMTAWQRTPPAAYVYSLNDDDTGWELDAILEPDDVTKSNFFGLGMAFKGDTAIVGAYIPKPSVAAYLFARSNGTWGLKAKLTPNDDTEGEEYVALNIALSAEDTVVIGAPRGITRGDTGFMHFVDLCY